MRTAFRLFDLQVHAGVVLYAHDLQERADGFRGRALPADHLPHVHRVHAKREQDSHLVDLAIDFHIFRMIHQRFHEIFEKFLVCGR